MYTKQVSIGHEVFDNHLIETVSVGSAASDDIILVKLPDIELIKKHSRKHQGRERMHLVRLCVVNSGRCVVYIEEPHVKMVCGDTIMFHIVQGHWTILSHHTNTNSVWCRSFCGDSIGHSLLGPVTYINLNNRPDRKSQFETQMDLFGVQSFSRFPAIKRDPGYIGCSESHLSILRSISKNNTANYYTIFEDDFIWKDDIPYMKKRLEEFFKSGVKWDVLLLCASTWLFSSKPTNIEGFHRAVSCGTTSGYIVNAAYVKTLIHNIEESLLQLEKGGEYATYAIDQYWKLLQQRDNWFITYPGFGKQSSGFSDIEKVDVDYKFI